MDAVTRLRSRNAWTLTKRRVDAIAATASVRATHAIAATALSRTRRDGPDAFQRLKLEKETTPGLV